ncbi:HEXXH motif-containing protein [Streptomyces sp. 3330]|uniref:aKG-HExxH-type peptide beta-hydroxylase n=1 Tax=Streptomyces sp. 3330 TaxID=2817755 RepID=UPI00285612FD|nr:HEXXH motif-containing putative peptide modification protein [Streptomyces sp. 3330]MDR6976793.1 HEXXH motif-containing protein [Streptomyces sp. 3330]
MTLPAIPDRALTELGRSGGGPETLALLARDQDARRLLLLRAVLDAAQAADPAVCSAAERSRLRDDWALLAEADRAAPPGRRAPEAPGGGAPSFARARLLYPLTGPWALSCLRGLDPAERPPTEENARELRRALAHFSALAAVAAARSGIPFTVGLTGRDGVLNLPSLGTLHTATAGDVPVRVTCARGRVTLRRPDAADVTVFLERGFGAWSGALAWTPAHALPGLVPEADPLPLDDLDPYRTARGDPRHRALSAPTTLDDPERKRWLQAWSGTAAALRTGGAHREAEALALLRCLVPLEMPPDAEDDGGGGCSATRRDAFGALLCSTPPSPVAFAGTLVHELQHAKLAALSDLTTLHHAGPEARYFAPWRPDPRPFDGLLQGAYAHLGLADFFQRRALTADPAHREPAWAQHARYRAQVGAALPALVGAPHLTAPGRRFVDAMATAYEDMGDHPAPRGHTARAQAYLKAARTLWTRRQAPSVPRPNG